MKMKSYLPNKSKVKTETYNFMYRRSRIYLTRRLRHDSLQEIGAQFQIKKYSSVSSIVERMKDRIGTDRKDERPRGKPRGINK